MSRSKGKKSSKRKGSGKESSGPPVDGPFASVSSLVETAHVHLAQQDFANGIACLRAALGKESGNREVKELLGIAECESGDVDSGREHLLQLIPPHNPHPTYSTYLYLAQTSDDPRDALRCYEQAIGILNTKIERKLARKAARRKAGGGVAAVGEPMEEVDGEAEGDDAMEVIQKVGVHEEEDDEVMDEAETVTDAKKDVVTALIAMVEIWMSDLCFDESAPSACDALIARALEVLPRDADARITLANIRMSQSKPDEAKGWIVDVAREVLSLVKRMDMVQEGQDGEVDAEEPSAAAVAIGSPEMDAELELPPLPTRRLLARLLLEHSLYTLALRVIDTVRNEDELDVEGCYLEGWAWFCRGEALGADSKEGQEDEAEEVRADAREWGEDEDVIKNLNKEGCWVDALASLMECRALHEASSHPDEGILAHTLELIETLENAGVEVEIDDDEDAANPREVEAKPSTGADVDMS